MSYEPSQDDFRQLWGNLSDTFLRLPKPHSSYKRELVGLLLPNISHEGQVALSGIYAPSTLSSYVNADQSSILGMCFFL